jgi:hypothetical protein
MAKAMIPSYDSRIFKINYFHGAAPNSPGIIFIYSKIDKKNLILQRNLIQKSFYTFKNFGFHILMVDLCELNPSLNDDNNLLQTQLSSPSQMASMIQDCYTCIEYFLKLFPKMKETWTCSFSYESVLTLQIIMRMLTLEKFILICPKLFNFDTQNISSCTAQGLIIYVNNKKKKENQNLEEIVNILKQQKKVYVDMVKIDTNEEYLQTKLDMLEKILSLYIMKNYSESLDDKLYDGYKPLAVTTNNEENFPENKI